MNANYTILKVEREITDKGIKLQPRNIKAKNEKEMMEIGRYLIPLEIKPQSKFKNHIYKAMKRMFDVICSTLGIIILSPVFLISIIAIKCSSYGPAVFLQDRIGQDGKHFKLYKFRSMVMDADKKLFELLENDEDARREYRINKKLKNDPRVTEVGKFIRKTSIDELPQLFNILKGDMSIVGPRPYLPREKEDMGAYYSHIIESKPGLTGLWQVSGRSNTTFEERLELDYEYNKIKNLKEDASIFVKTVEVVIGGKGSM